jgi:hypothetical membrane protein
MNGQRYALFGIAGPLVAYFFIAMSIMLSPWFGWETNALSDLGHATTSTVAPLYNLGLLISGFFIMIYATTIFKDYAKYTSYCLLLSAFPLQLVATFDEVYGILHFVVSVLLFVSFGFASAAYYVERKSVLALTAFIVGPVSWILYWAGNSSVGGAVPETISSLAMVSWVIPSALGILRRQEK